MQMMKILIILGSGVLAVAGNALACDYPREVSVPDGGTATKDDMLNGQKDVKTYMAAMEGYLACLDEESAGADEDQTDEQKTLHTKRHNAAVEAMEGLAARFNEEVRAYKAAGQ